MTLLPSASETVRSESSTPPSLMTALAPKSFTLAETVVSVTLLETSAVYDRVLDRKAPKSIPLRLSLLSLASVDSVAARVTVTVYV